MPAHVLQLPAIHHEGDAGGVLIPHGLFRRLETSDKKPGSGVELLRVQWLRTVARPVLFDHTPSQRGAAQRRTPRRPTMCSPRCCF